MNTLRQQVHEFVDSASETQLAMLADYMKLTSVPSPKKQKKNMRGALAAYANPALIQQEKGAWARIAVEKYGNV